MWFERLMGFREESPQQVRNQLVANGTTITSTVNGRAFTCGTLDTPCLAEARLWLGVNETAVANKHRLTVNEIVANVQQLHTLPANAGALFQVASQFNLLEMVSPTVTPEQGVGIYEHDKTQGPACAIAAGAGTIYRNYFAPVNGEIGQTADRQIDCLADVGQHLATHNDQLWQMCNGYALATEQGLTSINSQLEQASPRALDAVRQLLRVGVQWQTQVTLGDATQLVSQVYCSALPVAYSALPAGLWQRFARLILEAAYEATLLAGIKNTRLTGNNRVFLTLLGGGVFGNNKAWIIAAIRRALVLHQHSGLAVYLVSYGTSDPHVQALVKAFK